MMTYIVYNKFLLTHSHIHNKISESVKLEIGLIGSLFDVGIYLRDKHYHPSGLVQSGKNK